MKSSEKTLREHSKFLSLVLRHQPETIAIQLDSEGWPDVHILLQQMIKHRRPLKLVELIEVVESSDKKRFQLSPDQSKIRAYKVTLVLRFNGSMLLSRRPIHFFMAQQLALLTVF